MRGGPLATRGPSRATGPRAGGLCCDGRVVENDTDPVLLRSVAEQLATEAADVRACTPRRSVRRCRRTSRRRCAPRARRPTPSPSSTPRPRRCCATGWPSCAPGNPSWARSRADRPDSRDGRLTWVLDPIDGTVNFVYGIETYAVSVAVQRDGASVAGAVANVPTGALYSAAVGHGAHLQRAGVTTPLRSSAASDLSMSLVGTGFSYAADQRARQAEVLTALIPAVRDIRRFGSCALDLCMVAAGRSGRLLRGRRACVGLGRGRV